MPGNLAEALGALNMAGRDPDLDALASSWVQKVRDLYAPQREPYEREWALSMRSYLTQDVGANYAGRSNLRLPTAFVLNERVIPRVVAGTVGRGVFFDAAPKSGDQQRQARIQRDLLTYQLEEMNFREKFTPLMRSTAIYGTGVAKRRWRYEVGRVSRVVKREEPFGVGPGGPTMVPRYEPVEVDAILFDGPDLDELDIFSVFMDVRASCNAHTDILEERQVTRTWLLRQARQGILSRAQLEKVFASDTPGGDAANAPATTAGQNIRDVALGQQPVLTKAGDRTYLYRECWCEFPLGAKPGEEYETETSPALIVTVNGVPCRIARNPMPDHEKPYLFPVFIQVPGRRYGLSLTATNLGLFIEKNDTRNMALDAKNLAMVPMMKTRDPKMQGKVLEVEPGRLIVDPSGSLSPITLTDTSPSGYMAEAHINRDAEDAFGAPPTLSGQPLQGGGGSATEVATTTEQAGVRIASYGYTVEETLLKKLLRGMANDNRAFLDKEKQIRVQGDDGFEWPIVTPLDAQAECDFIMLGASQLTMKMVLGSQYAGLIPVMQSVEQQKMMTGGGAMFDWTFIFRTIFRDVFGFPHPELVVLPTPSDLGRPRSVREMLVLIAQGHTPRIDPRIDLADAMHQVASLLIAVEGRIDPSLEVRYRDFLLDLQAAAEKKILLETAARAEATGVPPGAGVSSRPPSPTGAAQRDGEGQTPGRRAMVALGGGPMGRGRAA